MRILPSVEGSDTRVLPLDAFAAITARRDSLARKPAGDPQPRPCSPIRSVPTAAAAKYLCVPPRNLRCRSCHSTDPKYDLITP